MREEIEKPVQKLDMLLADARFEARVPVNARMSLKLIVETAHKMQSTLESLRETGVSDRYDATSLSKDFTTPPKTRHAHLSKTKHNHHSRG